MGTSVAGARMAACTSVGLAGPQAGRQEADPLQEPGSLIFAIAGPSWEALQQPLTIKVVLSWHFASEGDSAAGVLPTQVQG